MQASAILVPARRGDASSGCPALSPVSNYPGRDILPVVSDRPKNRRQPGAGCRLVSGPSLHAATLIERTILKCAYGNDRGTAIQSQDHSPASAGRRLRYLLFERKSTLP